MDPKGFTVRDSSGSTLVLAPSNGEILPGARVSIIGFGAIAPFRPVLRATRMTKTGQESPPPPRAMDFHASHASDLHMELVEVKADFLGLRSGKLGIRLTRNTDVVIMSDPAHLRRFMRLEVRR